jgi:hypothetical protein
MNTTVSETAKGIYDSASKLNSRYEFEKSKEILNAEVFLRQLYNLCKQDGRFSVNSVMRENGFKDTRLVDFLQDVNILKNLGAVGRNAIWTWNTNVTPSELMAKNFIKRFDAYKYNLTKAADKNPVELRHFPELSEGSTFTKEIPTSEYLDIHEKLNELLAFQQIQNKMWMEKIDLTVAQSNYKLSQINEKLHGTNNRISVLRQTLINQTISIPMFFKMFTVKISFNKQ